MYSPDERTKEPHRRYVEEECKYCSGPDSQRNPAEGEGECVQQGFSKCVEDRQIGGAVTQQDAVYLPPGGASDYLDVRKEETEECNTEEGKAGFQQGL